MPAVAMRLLPMQEPDLLEAVASWRRDFPGCGILALLPEAEKEGLPLLQELCRRSDVPLAGGIFPALLTADGFVTQGVWLLRVDRWSKPAIIGELGDSEAAAGRIGEVVGDMLAGRSSTGPTPTLFMLFDGLVPNIASILDALYLELADRVRYAGANAGSETFQPMPCLFDAEQVLGNAALCLLLEGGTNFVLEHGYPASSRVVTATSTAGNRIDRIDWQPAFDVYREVIGHAFGVALTPENFYEHAVHFPFGILRADSGVVVRIPVGLTEDGALHCVGEVPENAMLVLLQAPSPEDIAGSALLIREMQTVNGPLAGRGLLTFYCAGRRMHLGQSSLEEIRQLDAGLAPGGMAGALSLGEIGDGQCWSYPLFHNAAVLCTPWPAG